MPADRLGDMRRWLDRVTAVVDEAHAENLGGRHRSGFCEACAEAQLVAQRAVPNDEGAVAALEQIASRNTLATQTTAGCRRVAREALSDASRKERN